MTNPKTLGVRYLTPFALGVIVLLNFGLLTDVTKEVNGVVTFSYDYPSTGASRYVTYYTVRAADGTEQNYTSRDSDGALQRSLPVGTVLHKQKWQLDYSINGTIVRYPWSTYYATLIIPALAVLADILRLAIKWYRRFPFRRA